MSKFSFTVAKATQYRTFKSHTQVIVIANPIEKNFNEEESLIPQINITPDLLSRFSCISAVLQPDDVDYEIRINDVLLSRSKQTIYERDLLQAEKLKKCIKIASQHHCNIDTDLVRNFLNNFTKQSYILGKRLAGTPDGDFFINITPRHRHSLLKVIKAVATWHLHPEPTKTDLDEAFALMASFWKEFIDRPNLMNMRELDVGMTIEEIEKIVDKKLAVNKFDVIQDNVKSESKRNKIGLLLNQIKRIQGFGNKGVSWEQIKEIGVDGLGFTEYKLEKIIERLRKDGDLIEPKKGMYRVLL